MITWKHGNIVIKLFQFIPRVTTTRVTATVPSSTEILTMADTTTTDVAGVTTGGPQHRSTSNTCQCNFINNLSNPRGTRLSGGRPYQSQFDYQQGTREDTFLEFVSQYFLVI